MKKPAWQVYALSVALAEVVGVISGLLSRDGMKMFAQTVAQPAFSPPAWLFPLVWTVLYGLMGVGAARIYMSDPSAQRSMGLNVYATQLVVNFFWSLIFFNLQAFGLAFVWLIVLWVLVAWMIYTFAMVDPLAAFLQVPYLLWLTFAAVLNGVVWAMNR